MQTKINPRQRERIANSSRHKIPSLVALENAKLHREQKSMNEELIDESLNHNSMSGKNHKIDSMTAKCIAMELTNCQ